MIKIKAKDLRKKHSERKQNCYICDLHRDITELHHILSLADCAMLRNICINVRSNKGVWLCPNHHVYFHKVEKDPMRLNDLTETEVEKFLELFDIRVNLMGEAIHKKQVNRNAYING